MSLANPKTREHKRVIEKLTASDEDEARELAESRKKAILLRAEDAKGAKGSQGLKLSGFEDPLSRQLIEAGQKLMAAGMPTLSKILPVLLQLKGKPYSLENHFPFEPFFHTHMPLTMIWLTGRQVSKSTSLAAQGIVFTASIPYLATLFITPLFEQIRRFSHNNVRRFIETSPVKKLFIGSQQLNNVLQRNFVNESSMYFSYAFLDAERTRGIPADRVCLDELNNFSFDLLQIIFETLSGSPWSLRQFTGTPGSLDGTAHAVWQDSSQAEWVIRCREGGCRHLNVARSDRDLLDMMGDWSRDISEETPAIVCAKCRKPLSPRTGRWVHDYPSRRFTSAGYHVPQQIIPLHYASPAKWDLLLAKLHGKAGVTRTTFLNEVCGEATDEGSKLITVTDLKAAAVLPWHNVASEAKQHLKQYIHRILAVDWGGGGGRISASKRGDESDRLRTSFTTLAVMGLRADGKVDVIWGKRSLLTFDPHYESRLCLEAMHQFSCKVIAHDYSGAGADRILLMQQAGLPSSSIVNLRFVGPMNRILQFHAAVVDHPTNYYTVDKARSILLVCQCLKLGLMQTFKFDYASSDNVGLLSDFLALVSEKMDSRSGTDSFVITRNVTKSDDFAMSCVYGAVTLWHMGDAWPNVAAAANMMLSPELMKNFRPEKADWGEDLL